MKPQTNSMLHRILVFLFTLLVGCGETTLPVVTPPGGNTATTTPPGGNTATTTPPGGGTATSTPLGGNTATTTPSESFFRVQQPVPGQYIVALKADIFGPQVEAVATSLASDYGGLVLHVYQSALKGFSVQMPESVAIALSKNPHVAYVEEDGVVLLESHVPWGLDRIDQRGLPLDDTYVPSPSGGTGVTVYVIDTGILPTHHEFDGRASIGYDALGGDGSDCHGHGTHVAGTVGGKTYGVAKNVHIVGVRVFDCTGQATNVSQIIAGVEWVTANHISPAVANMSLSTEGGSVSLDTAVKNSIASGVTYVVAAGNHDVDADSVSPARVAEAITVGATDPTDTRAVFSSFFFFFFIKASNYGAVLDLFAPGKDIISAYHTSDVATETMSGTSMAAPHVAGVVALYLQSYPTATPATIQQRIVLDATRGRVRDPGTGSPDRLLFIPPPPLAAHNQFILRESF